MWDWEEEQRRKPYMYKKKRRVRWEERQSKEESPACIKKGKVGLSNVKPTFFKDRKLSFSCFCSKKDRIYSFLKQNSGSKQNAFYQY